MTAPRAQEGPTLALALALACVAAALAGWAGKPALLGAATLAVITLSLAFGWKRGMSAGVLWSLAGIFVLFSVLIGAMAALDDPAGEPRLWLGLPAPTALLVYGIWPLGILPSLLYALLFRNTVLPEDRLARFLATHSRHKK